jgi:NAD(P)-dependent dehydrogenase (short-subunit alcohol dehydrogenase family)
VNRSLYNVWVAAGATSYALLSSLQLSVEVMTMTPLRRLYDQMFRLPPDPTDASFEGKTVLVTGATAGLGFEAALKFLERGAASLIIGCRSVERGQQAKEELERRANRTGVVQVWQLDQSRFQSVREFVERLNKEIPKLDVALLNAGILHREYTVSPDGREDTLQVNTLSTALLGVLLLPKLRESSSDSSPAHLTIVSSGKIGRVREEELPTEGGLLKNLSSPEGRSSSKRYGPSKLLGEYVARKIAELTRDPDGRLQLIVNTAMPGLCSSSLFQQFNRFYERWAMRFVFALIGRTPEQGSRVLVSATVQGVESHGKAWQGIGYFE